MQALEKRGRTVEEAVRMALSELGVEREAVDVEVLEEGSKGIFGLLAREARVLVKTHDAMATAPKATAKVAAETAMTPDAVESAALAAGDGGQAAGERAVKLLADISRAMGLTVNCEVKTDDEAIRIDVSGPEVGNLIGRRGQTLDALQYLVSLAAYRSDESGERRRVIVDVEGYRRRREETLRRLAVQLADRARRSGRDVMLEPMSAQERRIIHLELQDSPYVTTRSIGEEPYRKVVISAKR
jgi:spoIIIJ-associated protein